MKEDGLDHFRKEYNEMLLSKVSGTNNSVVQDRYITVTVAKRNIDEARTYFSRVGTDLITHLSQPPLAESWTPKPACRCFGIFSRRTSQPPFPSI